MARSGIRYEEVQNAAETLLGRGLNPTIQRVRELLGTGSNTTISEHLRNWQQQMAAAPRAVLPPAMPETVATAVDTFWKTAVQHAETAFEAHRLAAEQAVAAAEQARDEAAAEQARWQTAARELQQELDSSRASARSLADRLLVEQERRASAELAVQAAEQRIQAAAETVAQIRAETTARVGRLETTLEQLRTDMEQRLTEAQQRFELEHQHGEASEARWLALLDQARSEQRAERQSFATERQDWTRQETLWREQREAQQRENGALNAALQAHVTAARERQDVLMAELAQIRAQLQESEAKYLENVRETEGLRGELRGAQEERKRLQQQLDARSTATKRATTTGTSARKRQPD